MDTQFDASRKISLGGTIYAKGIGGQAGGSVSFDLGGTCTSFSATIGIDDYNFGYATSHGQPKVWSTFTLTDQANKVIKNVNFTAPDDTVQTFTADVTGVQQLTLANNNYGSNGYYAHADWANAKVSCNGTSVPAPPEVTSQPASQSVADGTPVTLAAAANGTDASHGWQVSRDGGTTWNPLSNDLTGPPPGAATASAQLNVTVGSADSGVQYRALFANAGGVTASAPATITVSGAPGKHVRASQLKAALSDSLSAAGPGQTLPYQGTVTVGASPATDLQLAFTASSKAPLATPPVVTATSSTGAPLPVIAAVTTKGNVHTLTINGTLPARAVVTLSALGTVGDGLPDGSGDITATLTAGTASPRPEVAATDSTAVSYKAALDSLFTDNTRSPLPGAQLTYTSTTTVGRGGFLNAGANYGPAENVTLHLVPDATLPFTGQPVVSLVDDHGAAITVPHTTTGSGTNADPYVVMFTAPVPQGVITTKTPPAVPAGAAYGTRYGATLLTNLSNNGRAAAPATVTDIDQVDNAPTVQNNLSVNRSTIRAGESFNFTATTKVVNGAANKLVINLYGTPAAPLDDNPKVTATLPNGDSFPVTATVARSITAYTVNIHEVVPANATITVQGSGMVLANPAPGAAVSVRQTASAVNLGGDPTRIDGKQVTLALQ